MRHKRRGLFLRCRCDCARILRHGHVHHRRRHHHLGARGAEAKCLTCGLGTYSSSTSASCATCLAGKFISDAGVKRHPPYFGNCLRKSPNSPVELASASAMSLHRQNISSLPPNTEIMRISVSYDDPEHVLVYRNLQIISKLDNLSVFVVVQVCIRIKLSVSV